MGCRYVFTPLLLASGAKHDYLRGRVVQWRFHRRSYNAFCDHGAGRGRSATFKRRTSEGVSTCGTHMDITHVLLSVARTGSGYRYPADTARVRNEHTGDYWHDVLWRSKKDVAEGNCGHRGRSPRSRTYRGRLLKMGVAVFRFFAPCGFVRSESVRRFLFDATQDESERNHFSFFTQYRLINSLAWEPSFGFGSRAKKLSSLTGDSLMRPLCVIAEISNPCFSML